MHCTRHMLRALQVPNLPKSPKLGVICWWYLLLLFMRYDLLISMIFGMMLQFPSTVKPPIWVECWSSQSSRTPLHIRPQCVCVCSAIPPDSLLHWKSGYSSALQYIKVRSWTRDSWLPEKTLPSHTDFLLLLWWLGHSQMMVSVLAGSWWTFLSLLQVLHMLALPRSFCFTRNLVVSAMVAVAKVRFLGLHSWMKSWGCWGMMAGSTEWGSEW